MGPRRSHSRSKRKDDEVFICDLCATAHSTKSSIRSHMYLHFSDGVYTCNRCPLKPIFHHSEYFRRHVDRVHCRVKLYECKRCSKSFKTESRLDSHKIKHSNARSFRCTYCNQRFKYEQSMRSHIKSFHNSTGPGKPRTGRAVLICDLCGKEFISKSNLRRHFHTHYPDGQFPCKLCGKVFEHSKLYEVHKKICLKPAQKRVQSRYRCDRCDKDFLTKFRFESHIVIHSSARNFHCTQCPKRFKRKRHLQLHLKNVHAEKKNVQPTKPKKCTKTEILYSTEGELSCITCRKIFLDIESFEKHFITFHDPKNPNTAKRGKEQKKFRCKRCDAIYTNKRRLEKHMVEHYYEKKVECDYCDRRFKNKTNLQTHIQNCHLENQPHTILLIMCDEKFEKILYQREVRLLHMSY